MVEGAILILYYIGNILFVFCYNIGGYELLYSFGIFGFYYWMLWNIITKYLAFSNYTFTI